MEFAQDKQGNMWVSTAGVDIYLISHQDGTMTKKQLFPSTFTFIPSIIASIMAICSYLLSISRYWK